MTRSAYRSTTTCGMIRCVLSRGSCTASLLRAGIRNHSTTTPAEEDTPKSKALASLSSPFGKNASYTSVEDDLLLEEYDGVLKKAFGQVSHVSSRPSYEYPADYAEAPDLPVSPFMDPEYSAAKQKFRAPKAPPSKTLTDFQTQLAKNAYAKALATPVRYCALSRIQLPKFFLQDFRLMAHPETREPWWVPQNLTKYRSVGESAEELSTEGQSELQNVDTSKGSDPAPEFFGSLARQDNKNKSEGGVATTVDHRIDQQAAMRAAVQADTDLPRGKQDQQRIGPAVWLASRKELLAALQVPSTGYGTEAWKRISVPLLTRKTTEKVVEKSNWRRDMDIFVLELMRKRARQTIMALCKLKRGYLAGSQDWKEASSRKRQAAAILWMGRVTNDKVIEEGEEQLYGPPEFATFDIEPVSSAAPGASHRTKIPVHNLRMLLGRDHLQKLREKYPMFKQELVIIRDRRRALDVILKLWKLQGYLARYEEFFTLKDAQEVMNSLKMQRLPKDHANAESAREYGKGDSYLDRMSEKRRYMPNKIQNLK